MEGKIQDRTQSQRSDDTNGRRFIRVDATYSQEDRATATSQLIALQKKGLISYDLLWCLFPPRAEVYTDINALHEPQVLLCNSHSYLEDEQTGEKWFAVQSECLNHDGQNFGWSEQVLIIPYFTGAAKVTSLFAYPLAYHPDEKNLRGRLHARGKAFIGLLAKPTCREYGATALISRRNGSEWEQETSHIPGRVMIDPSRYCVSKPDSSSDPLRGPSCPQSRAFPPANTPDKDLMFCHHRIIGFSLGQKAWAALAVSQLRDLKWDGKALDSVMMAPARRELLRTVVSAYQAEAEGQYERSDSYSNSRGRGLAGLLSGPPGVGKTVTAEAVAEVLRRPLYAVGAGELGSEAADVDRRLGKLLAVASSWKCVLLIEDCDALAPRRDPFGPVNGALVSTFRRRLECFQGLAILTTTRIEDIDKALLSRLQFKINYDDLGSNQRLAVWKSSLCLGANLSEKEVVRIATDYELNGHEIKNAVSCAKLIAQVRGTKLTAALIQEVLGELSPRCSTIQETNDLPNGFPKDAHPSRNGTENSTHVQRLGGSGYSVNDMTRNMQQNALSFEANQLLRPATQDQVDKTKLALKARNTAGVSVTEKNLPVGNTFIYAGSGDLNIQLGNGDMFTVNSGGVVNKAQRMSVEPTPI